VPRRRHNQPSQLLPPSRKDQSVDWTTTNWRQEATEIMPTKKNQRIKPPEQIRREQQRRQGGGATAAAAAAAADPYAKVGLPRP
jgi:hypothetical protein